MNFNQLFATRPSREASRKISEFIAEDPELFNKLIDCFLGSDTRMAQYSATTVGNCLEAHPSLALPHMERLVSTLEHEPATAVERTIVRAVSLLPLETQYHGRMMDICFRLLNDPSKAIAIRVHAMMVLYRMSMVYREIIPELDAILQLNFHEQSTGFKNRAAKIIGRTLKAEPY